MSSRKRCSFQSHWVAEYPWIRAFEPNNHKATCTICNKNIDISHGKTEIKNTATAKGTTTNANLSKILMIPKLLTI